LSGTRFSSKIKITTGRKKGGEINPGEEGEKRKKDKNNKENEQRRAGFPDSRNIMRLNSSWPKNLAQSAREKFWRDIDERASMSHSEKRSMGRAHQKAVVHTRCGEKCSGGFSDAS